MEAQFTTINDGNIYAVLAKLRQCFVKLHRIIISLVHFRKVNDMFIDQVIMPRSLMCVPKNSNLHRETLIGSLASVD